MLDSVDAYCKRRAEQCEKENKDNCTCTCASRDSRVGPRCVLEERDSLCGGRGLRVTSVYGCCCCGSLRRTACWEPTLLVGFLSGGSARRLVYACAISALEFGRLCRQGLNETDVGAAVLVFFFRLSCRCEGGGSDWKASPRPCPWHSYVRALACLHYSRSYFLSILRPPADRTVMEYHETELLW